MAQKQKLRPSHLDEPPTASSSSSSSSSSEEEISSEEEVSSEEDNEKEENLPPAPTNSHPQPSSSDSETQSESDTIPAKVKPLVSKPKAQAQAQAPSNSGSKRPAEAKNVTDPKRVKKKSSNNSSSSTVAADEEKKTLRRWSEEDELAILKGALDFTSKKKQDPLKITNAFHDFITKSLDWQVSRNQLKSKLQGLKRKFDTNSAKGENGEGPSFSKPHDQKVFELSKKAWGTEQGGGPSGPPVEKPKSNGSASKKKETGSSNSRNAAAASAKKSKPEIERETKSELESEKIVIDHMVDSGSVGLLLRELSPYKEAVQLDEDEVKRGLELIGESKRAELAGKWKELRYAETKLLAKRSRLIAEQTKLIVDVRQSSGDYDSQ